MPNLTHFSLFTGIGGIDIAAEWAGIETVGQCEIDDYAHRVLEKHFPNVPKWRDIHDVTVDDVRERTGIERGELTLLSGGFPCQPHSLAGKRKGAFDERDLWGEFRRVICDLKPKWVLGENVPGLLSTVNGRFFGRILRDFSEMGYHVGWCVYGAVDVGAWHKRDRVFIVANTNENGWRCLDKNKQNKRTAFVVEKPYNHFDEREQSQYKNILRFYVERQFANPSSGVLRNDDGLSQGMDRLKCLGNAVVPQQVFPILEEIADFERMGCINSCQTE
jgi:DNA (cytosine-5)-methyltransferase 1